MRSFSKVVVIGASAGGADALTRLLALLDADFPAPMLTVMHVGSHDSILPQMLQRQTRLPVRHAADREALQPGIVLVAPPDRHLLLDDGETRLMHGPKENFARPAIDPLFRSAAIAYRANAIGVILSGMLDDGTIGLHAIKAYGGVALVQDPDEADEPSMPRSALHHVPVDGCLRVTALAERLNALAREPAATAAAVSGSTVAEAEARFDQNAEIDMEELQKIGVPSGLTCPECHGALWEIGTQPPHFRCHTGHAFTAQGLPAAHDLAVEEAMRTAIRALHEKKMLLQRLARSAENARRNDAADEHNAAAEAAARHADTLRRIVVGDDA